MCDSSGNYYFCKSYDLIFFLNTLFSFLDYIHSYYGVSEWLLFNAKSTIFQLYHGENKLIFQWDDDEVRFVLDQHA
jgi:hypothetical protein